MNFTHERPYSRARRVPWVHGEAGASLVIAMAVLVMISILATAVLTYAQVSYSSTSDYRVQRAERYGADGAINAAINWARNNSHVAIDPELGDPAAENCQYTVPAADGVPEITVTCNAEAGSGSGQPTDTGLVPDQAMVLLGQRYGETPAYSPCAATPEYSLLFERSAPIRGSSTCDNSAAINEFSVNGDIVANAPLRVNQGTLVVKDGTVTAGTSAKMSNAACVSGSVMFLINDVQDTTRQCQKLPTDRPRTGAVNGPAASPYDPGEHLATDPRIGNEAAWPRGVVPTDSSGNWIKGSVSINGGAAITLTRANVATLSAQCGALAAGVPRIVRFYPGWYDDARALTDLFNSSTCNASDLGRYWFQPAPGSVADNPTQAPLTSAAKQGVYLFDFRNTDGGTECGRYDNTNNIHRWCLAASATNGPKVVAGWPKGWDPGTVTGGSTSPTYVEMTTANRITAPFLSGWSNRTRAATIDNSVTTYQAPLSFTNRRLTLADFSPKVATGGANRKIRLTVRHRERVSANVGEVWMRLRTQELDGRVIDCGNFLVPKTPTTSAYVTDVVSTDAADPLKTVTATPAETTRLQNCFATPERANKIEVNWQLEGVWNGFSPLADLDGVKISIESPPDSWFNDAAARPAIYCDEDQPGAQFIFGGDSQMHAAGATFQICAGPTDTNPQQHQQIAIWGEPSIGPREGPATIRPGSVQRTTSGNGDGSLTNGVRATRADDPYWNPSGTGDSTRPSSWGKVDVETGLGTKRTHMIARGFGDVGTGSCSSGVSLCLGNNLGIAKVEVKVNYDTNCGGGILGGIFGICIDGAQANPWLGLRSDSASDVLSSEGNSEYKTYDDRSNNGFPGIRDGILWYTNDITADLNLGTDGRNVNRLNDLALRWVQNCNVCWGGNEGWLEGIELLVTVKPIAATTQVVTPSTGCRSSSSQGFGAGTGDLTAAYNSAYRGRDCALISGGRIAVMGTIYSPSDALEISDGSALYPFASRGMVARHLRVRKYAKGTNYSGDTVSTEIDPTPMGRDTVFTACIRSTPSTENCGTQAGDQILSQARVVITKENVPSIQWWETVR